MVDRGVYRVDSEDNMNYSELANHWIRAICVSNNGGGQHDLNFSSF